MKKHKKIKKKEKPWTLKVALRPSGVLLVISSSATVIHMTDFAFHMYVGIFDTAG